MNIILTCAGRRNYLIQYFKAALGGAGRVFAADVSPNAPALQEADEAFIVPAVGEAGYVERLLMLCRENKIALLIPLNDLELPVLSREHARFSDIGTTLLVSSSEVVETCFDKWATAKFLERAGISGPKTYLTAYDARSAICLGEAAFPLILKPRWGSSSIFIEPVFEDSELEAVLHLTQRRINRAILAGASAAGNGASVIIQERLNGHEYGLDVINDLAGRYLGTLIRRKLGMRAGETDSAVTVRSPDLEKLGERIGTQLGHVGTADCDVFVSDGKASVLEINPRFGGGYPFSHMAGANLPAILLALVDGRKPDACFFAVEPDMTMGKYDCIAAILRPGRLPNGTPGIADSKGLCCLPVGKDKAIPL